MAIPLVENPDLRITSGPQSIYEFNERLWTNESFRETFKKNPQTVLSELNLDRDFTTLPSIPQVPGLSEQEVALLEQTLRIARKHGFEGQEAIEVAMADSGYVQPALAAIVLAVVLWVVLWVA